MSISVLEITDSQLVPDCVDVHKRIFQLSDIDAFPPAYFHMLIRKEHQLGFLIGCFDTTNAESNLVGLAVATQGAENNSLYIPFIGLLPNYQNGRCGFEITYKLKECAIKYGYKKIFGIYDPLEANLGKLYSFLGARTIGYINQPYRLDSSDNNPDKVIFELNLSKKEFRDPYKSITRICLNELIKKYPIVTNSFIDNKKILLEIPTNYQELNESKESEIKFWREKTKNTLIEYLNNRGYKITNCISGRHEGKKKTFYLLEN